ncbi:hypothetical protein OSCI_4070003 [Kamptonema sp. PCC 6506]|nr:hypothetical protein OSCI_4070003 [Kamptonema sp. PCC 6506]
MQHTSHSIMPLSDFPRGSLLHNAWENYQIIEDELWILFLLSRLMPVLNSARKREQKKIVSSALLNGFLEV